MREGACDDCKSWEEELYWTHFQYIRFSLFLHAGFDHHLAIPEKFTRNLIKKLPDTVTLKGPSGTAWEVGLISHDNILHFSRGWQEFVEGHSLEENDILVFKYNRESCFDVLMFDGQSMCEKAGSYFLTKCVPKEYKTTGCQTKRTGESSTEVLSASPRNGSGDSKLKKPTHNCVYTASGRPAIVPNKKVRREIKFAPVHMPNMKRKRKPGAVDVEAKAEITHPFPGLLNRRSKQDEATLYALQSAQAVVTPNGFIAVMKPSYVSKKFFMSIPWAWVSKHITSEENQYVILRIKEKTWKIRLYYSKEPNRGCFIAGWKSFVLDNSIKESDVCVFEPGIPLDNMIVLDVNIFRVVQEMSPPAPVADE
ncbi:B3 domain-containing protein REM16-like [Mercurialis annua]|uniref:B3 domain-containing protein REM16-like n=1 Tax=Mercurialis annua TaxID=3986 RepID=UPI00215FD1AF|nr:B3 domain-containing protein REM16-like [Mercurialis annua]XP_055960186.1 B3 domain-containing protein REM16-like [Mercurialis annua]XP_055960187.1 B3 domain-containing protein REM16-like [Mercurialis annua]